MTITKYYKLETSMKGDMSYLEDTLKECMLKRENVGTTVGNNKERTIESLDNSKASAESYDCFGIFEILYKNKWIKQNGKSRWFSEDIPLIEGVELVIEGTPNRIATLENHLSESDLKVNELRNANLASFTFGTFPAHSEVTENYKSMIESFVQTKYPSVKAELKIAKDVYWVDLRGDMCTGIIYGPVSDVLKIRKVLNSENVIALNKQSIEFLS